MSKDVVIAGVIVAACLGLVTVAFVVPKQKTVTPEIAKKEDPVVPTPPSFENGPGAPANDPFGLPNNNGTQPSPNPFPPVDPNPFALKPTPAPNPFPPLRPVEPPPALVPEKPVVAEAKSHVVATGETLGEISQKYYGTSKHWKKIAEANKVDASDLKTGQKLVIPAIEAPVATTPKAPELQGGERSYTVLKGDSYYSIAKKELGNAARWKELEKLNNIPAEDLNVGKVIKLPAKSAAVEALPGKPEAPATSDANTHVVKAGETLSDISKLHYGTTSKWKDIVKANPGIDPEGLKVGQKLKLPEIAGTPTVPSPAPGSSPSLLSPATGSPSASSDNPAATYTVKANEYLEDIAQSQLGSRGAWKKIVDANPGLDARKLRIGQKLVIPGKSAPAEAAPTKPKPSFGAPSGTPMKTVPASTPPGFGSGFPSTPSSQPGSYPPAGFPTTPSQPGSSPFPSSDNGFPSAGGSSYPPAAGTPPSGPGAFPGSAPVNDNPFAVPPAGSRPIP